MTFNYSGTQQSGGLSSFAATQLDIEAAYGFLAKNAQEFRVDTSRLFLVGWSYGGGMALTYAANHPEVEAVVSVAGTDHGEFIREYRSNPAYRAMIDDIFEALKQPDSPWRLAPGATPAEIEANSSEIEPYDLISSAPALADREVLLIGGWDDLNVKVERHLLPLYRALKSAGASHVQAEILQDDHSFAKVRPELVRTILDWMSEVDNRRFG
jgi:dipeptidyl aminopeptidase/acylaminoacyl peptidase